MFRNLRMLRLGGALMLLSATANGSSIRSSSKDDSSEAPAGAAEKGIGIGHPRLKSDDTQIIEMLQKREQSHTVRVDVLESSPDHKAKGCCATIFSCDSWKKMIRPTEETPTYLRRFISFLTWGSLAVGVLVPYIRHHDLGMMNASLVETISGTLATHPVWSKTWGTIGSCFGALAFWNLWKKDVADTWNNKTSTCCDKALTGLSLTTLTVGAIAQLGVLWLPIGGVLSSWHKYVAAAFFVPTATGMILYAWITAKKTGFTRGGIRKVWRTWLYVVLAFLIAIFAFSAPAIEGEKNQMKMTIPDCELENPNNTEICTAEGNILPKDSKWGDCRPERPNYEVPMKKKYACDWNPDDGNFNLDDFKTKEEATAVCERSFNKDNEPCYLTQTDLGGWMKNIGMCESENKKLRGPNDTCRKASARAEPSPDSPPGTLGKIDNDVFESNCAAATDTAGNVCDYTPASESETAWTWFSVLEMVSFSSALTMFGFVLTGA